MSNGARLAALVVVVAVAAVGLYFAFMTPSPAPAPATAGSEMPVALDAPSGSGSAASAQPGADALPAEAFGGPGTSVPSSTTPTTGASAGTASAGSLDLGAGASPAGGSAPGTATATNGGSTSGGAGMAPPASTVSGSSAGAVTPVPPPPAPPASDSGREYVVKSGDTLEAIARSQMGDGQKWKSIVAANPGINPTNLKIGQKIRIPAGDAPAPKSASEAPAASSGGSSTGNTYTVQRGDTLVALSRKFYGNDGEWKRILEANKSLLGNDPAKLKPGMKLAIPAKR